MSTDHKISAAEALALDVERYRTWIASARRRTEAIGVGDDVAVARLMHAEAEMVAVCHLLAPDTCRPSALQVAAGHRTEEGAPCPMCR